jgi:hypothetical protein
MQVNTCYRFKVASAMLSQFSMIAEPVYPAANKIKDVLNLMWILEAWDTIKLLQLRWRRHSIYMTGSTWETKRKCTWCRMHRTSHIFSSMNLPKLSIQKKQTSQAGGASKRRSPLIQTVVKSKDKRDKLRAFCRGRQLMANEKISRSAAWKDFYKRARNIKCL